MPGSVKASVFVGVSLDGFIAREDGAIDWLPFPGPEEAEAHGFKKFIDSIDAIVIGRKTYETVLALDHWSYYGGKPVIVLSGRPVSIPDRLRKTVESMTASPGDVVKALAKRGMKHLYVDGGKTIQGFLSAGLIHGLVITRVPILIGSGTPLFGALPRDVKLRHVRTQAFPSGLVQSEYEVLRKA